MNGQQQSQITFNIPALKGRQAGEDQYASIITMKYLVRVFRSVDSELPPKLRAQRKVNEARARKIAKYIVNNPTDFIIPALTASVSEEMTFVPITDKSEDGIFGNLHIPFDAKIFFNDGQHRRRGIEITLFDYLDIISEKMPDFHNQTVVLTINYDQGLEKAQQKFTDINLNAMKPSGSLTALYDIRNPLNRWMFTVLEGATDIEERLDMETASVSKNSDCLWSLIAFKKFCEMATGLSDSNFTKQVENGVNAEAESEFLSSFLAEIGQVIPRWSDMLDGSIEAPEVRETYIVGHTVFLHALAVLARAVRSAGLPLSVLKGLSKIDPIKNSDMWNGRCVINGKMRKTTDGVKSAANVMFKLCGIDLPEDMQALEDIISEQA